MTDSAIATLTGAAGMWVVKEAWNFGRDFFRDRQRRREERLEAREEKISKSEIRFAELGGQITGWNIRFEFITQQLAMLEKMKADLNAAHEKIRALERDRTKPLPAPAATVD